MMLRKMRRRTPPKTILKVIKGANAWCARWIKVAKNGLHWNLFLVETPNLEKILVHSFSLGVNQKE